MSQVLQYDGVAKSFGRTQLLKNVSLTLEEGRIVGLFGPEGSGKSILLKMINCMAFPTKGLVRVCEQLVDARSKAHVAYLPDRSFLDLGMSVKQYVDYYADLFEDFQPERVCALLEQGGISLQSRIKALSSGDRSRVCLALTMSRRAKLYVLDEPVMGTDPADREFFLTAVLKDLDPEATVLIATNEISRVEPILDEVVFLRQGEIYLHKTAESIRDERKMSVEELYREVFP